MLLPSILKLFAQNKDDRKLIEKALDQSGLPSNKNETINPLKFNFQDFFSFYTNLTQRKEISSVFTPL